MSDAAKKSMGSTIKSFLSALSSLAGFGAVESLEDAGVKAKELQVAHDTAVERVTASETERDAALEQVKTLEAAAVTAGENLATVEAARDAALEQVTATETERDAHAAEVEKLNKAISMAPGSAMFSMLMLLYSLLLRSRIRAYY